jgi:cytoskeletal protein CcmA (bactofilin family)
MIKILDAPALFAALRISADIEPREASWRLRLGGATTQLTEGELVKLVFGPERRPGLVPAASNEREPKESLIAADLTIEGKIEGTGHVRIAGKFKGDVNVQGDLTIETGAKLNGGVRAKKVTIAGELEGNIEAASRVELLSSGVIIGDLKAGSLTVAAGSRMRGQADFGWDDSKTTASTSKSGGKETGNDAAS